VENACVTRIEKAGHRNLPLGWRDFLDTPITEEHMKAAVCKGACNKAPRRDGIYLGFFKINWNNIKDGMQMYWMVGSRNNKNSGILVSIP